MQLFNLGRKSEVSFDDFWRQTAEKRGGEIGIITFATLLGQSGANILGLPGLMYTVGGGTVWFEDFEKDTLMARILGGKNKWEKTELSFQKSDVSFTRLVSKGTALRSINGGLAPESTRAISFLGLFFSTPALQIGFTQGHSLFFEVMRRDDMIGFLKPET